MLTVMMLEIAISNAAIFPHANICINPNAALERIHEAITNGMLLLFFVNTGDNDKKPTMKVNFILSSPIPVKTKPMISVMVCSFEM